MGFLTPKERAFLRAVSKLGYCNPFLPERIQYEREVLGPEFREAEPVWSMRVDDPDSRHVNSQKIAEGVESVARSVRERLAGGATATTEDLVLYEDVTLYLLYDLYRDRLQTAIVQALEEKRGRGQLGFSRDFSRDWQHYLEIPGLTLPTKHEAPHLFSCFFQVRRAFHHIFSYIIGGSMAVARLRAAVWQSIFTHDMRRYRDTLYQRMDDVTTLITDRREQEKSWSPERSACPATSPLIPRQLCLQKISSDRSMHSTSLPCPPR